MVLEAREGIQAAAGEPAKLRQAVADAADAVAGQAERHEARAEQLQELAVRFEAAVADLGAALVDAEALTNELCWDER